MAETAAASERGGRHQFLTFRIGDRRYALPAGELAEVIRVPPIARLPHSPKSLLGLANLRGAVLPVVSLGVMLGQQDVVAGPSARAIVLGTATPVVLAVDAVESLVSGVAGGFAAQQSELAAEPGEMLRGAFTIPPAQEVTKILDVEGMLRATFGEHRRIARPIRAPGGVAAPARQAAASHRLHLVTFDVARQEFALTLESVREIVAVPDLIAAAPWAEAVLLGVIAYRDHLVPLLSLRGLLGFPPAGIPDGREKVIVVRLGAVLIGLVADRVRALLHADAAQVEPTPAMLAARTGGEARIKAIFRAEDGRRLVSILTPDRLFREDVMQRLGSSVQPGEPGQAAGQGRATDPRAHAIQVLVFRLGDEEFALPISAVDEVARLPAEITRVPKTPDFLEGVINLRGDVLPVVDQRRRFDMPRSDAGGKRRLVVVRTDRHRAGLIVDSVSEVLRAPAEAVEPPPDLTDGPGRLISGVINLAVVGRMILLLEPAELLSRAERGLLDAFDSATAGSATTGRNPG